MAGPKTSLYQQWLISLSTVLLLYIAVTAAFNYVVDPFSLGKYHVIRYDRAEFSRRRNVPYWTMVEISKIPEVLKKKATIVLLGDSRARNLTGGYKTPRILSVGDDIVYNLAIGGGRLSELESIYRHEERYLDTGNISCIVLCLPFTSFCDANSENRIDHVNKNLPYYYIHAYITGHSFVSILYANWKFGICLNENQAAGTQPDEYQVTGLRISTKWDRFEGSEIISLEPKRVKQKLARWKRMIRKGYNRFGRNIELMRAFIKELKGKGITVVIWNPPYPDCVIQMIGNVDSQGKYQAYDQCMNEGNVFYDLCENKYDYDINYTFSRDMGHCDNNVEILSLLLDEKVNRDEARHN